MNQGGIGIARKRERRGKNNKGFPSLKLSMYAARTLWVDLVASLRVLSAVGAAGEFVSSDFKAKTKQQHSQCTIGVNILKKQMQKTLYLSLGQ